MQLYPAEVEQQMQRFYQSLSEKDCRRYAAVEAMKLGWGGLSYISQLLGCDDEAMQLGKRELDQDLRKGHLNGRMLELLNQVGSVN